MLRVMVAVLCVLLAGCARPDTDMDTDPPLPAEPDLRPVELLNLTWDGPASSGPAPWTTFEVARFTLPESTSRPLVYVTVHHSGPGILDDTVYLMDPRNEVADIASLYSPPSPGLESHENATLTGVNWFPGTWRVVYEDDALNPAERLAGTVVVTKIYP